MAFLPENNTWVDNITQLEVTDRVKGGPNGLANRQAEELARRTQFLRTAVEILGQAIKALAEEGLYTVPEGGIPGIDLDDEVKALLEKARTALQSVADATASLKGIATLGSSGGAARYGQKGDVGLNNVDDAKQLPIAGGTMTGVLTAGGTQAVGTAQARNIRASTTDLTAGSSALPTGQVYLVYE